MARTWIGYPDLEALASRYGINDPATVAAMGQAVEAVVGRAANVYTY